MQYEEWRAFSAVFEETAEGGECVWPASKTCRGAARCSPAPSAGPSSTRCAVWTIAFVDARVEYAASEIYNIFDIMSF